MFLDNIIINIKAGDGGTGIVSFKRNAKTSLGGPDGGSGGTGGNVWIQADSTLNDLSVYRFNNNLMASNGKNGKKQNQTGQQGDDYILKVPIGTDLSIIKNEKKELFGSFYDPKERIKLLDGGKGGKGNINFVRSDNKEPLLAEAGAIGLTKKVALDLKIISDFVFVSLPNAGKSSLLSLLSNAKPKIADYPFSTIYPEIGILETKFTKIKLLEVPALIEGSHKKLGLGNSFLKHISNTKALVLIISSIDNVNNSIKILLNEIEKFNPKFLDKQLIIVCSKIDLCNDSQKFRKQLEIALKNYHIKESKIYYLSNEKNENLEDFKSYMLKYVSETKLQLEETDVPIISIKYSEPKVIKKHKNNFEILDENFIRLANGSNLNQWKTLVQFQYRMRQSELFDELIRMGIKAGDLIKVGEYEFIWEE
ncbi:MAG: GTPase ObgE [Chloroflexi bacterium]|nr:GTPase ObgE [Chloroflexota bacterium]|tara:strand:+ start:2578 stop:3846 length:1269 start_codon:yes stop_codon:yes gene_type:complete